MTVARRNAPRGRLLTTPHDVAEAPSRLPPVGEAICDDPSPSAGMGRDPEGIGKMCGIAGEFVLGPSGAVDPENIGPMLSVLGHRGPDDWGCHVDERRRPILMHRRLSIVDVAGGRQPLSNEDGSIWTVFNGEIYDFA